jgi:hypothetical protein
MATFDKRGDLQWRARVRRRGYPVQSQTYNTRAEAEAWARQRESEMERGVFVSRTEAEHTTLEEALIRYAEEITPRKRGAARESYRIHQFHRHPLARRYLATLRGKDIADYIRESEAQGAGGNVIRLDLALLSHLFETCRSAWGMESLVNPVPLVKSARPKLPPGRNRRLQPGEEARLLAACSPVLAPAVSMSQGAEWWRSSLAGRVMKPPALPSSGAARVRAPVLARRRVVPPSRPRPRRPRSAPASPMRMVAGNVAGARHRRWRNALGVTARRCASCSIVNKLSAMSQPCRETVRLLCHGEGRGTTSAVFSAH